MWVSIPLSSATEEALLNRTAALNACGIDPSIRHIQNADAENQLIKVHVDYLNESVHETFRSQLLETDNAPGEYFYPLDSALWNSFPCRHRHDPQVCKCKCPLYHLGQDEAIFKQYSLPSHYWTCQGRSKLRPKTEGQGVMVSAFWDEFRGFGLDLTDEEIAKVNLSRLPNQDLPQISAGESPGMVLFQYGKNKDGYWDGAMFQVQCIDIMNVLEVLYPTMQILLEVDHSAGHLKEQSNGLMTNAMGLRWGGKTSAKRDTVIEEGCLGETVPVGSGRQLKIGMVQRMIFVEGDEPPQFSPKALPHDRPMTEIEKAKEIIRRQKKADSLQRNAEVDGEEVRDVEESFTVQGYVGQNKGIFQILYERGVYLPKMKGRQTQGVKEKLELKGKQELIVPPELDAHAVLEKCPDFMYEKTALQQVVESRGHILLPSVVCTPETAGGGIEYAWGKLKFEQRKENSAATKLESGVKFNERVRKLCKSKEILPMNRVFRFQRRARDYIRLYLSIRARDDESAPSFIDIERMRSKKSTHRNIMEVDRLFVKTS